ncbi:hypothetical protein BC937DRAFT_94840 [Endogone sp. FLAS-F59071]|nr:hypothetical protein BC937DRAFT_94840 [Endogone sp. FLAS-F59071]|eukprot:RUS13742.1 hypothetical protein BC937DRAFT_94840 [Endogone sp. FLAS-F59071]
MTERGGSRAKIFIRRHNCIAIYRLAMTIEIEGRKALTRVYLLYDLRNRSQSCIKGHRVATCRHFQRPLLELQKKGRPVSQCDHCRELRKASKSHVKCTCAISSDVINPINGCMCGVTTICTCVAVNDQDMTCCLPSLVPPSLQQAHVSLSDGGEPADLFAPKELWDLVTGDSGEAERSDLLLGSVDESSSKALESCPPIIPLASSVSESS